MLSYLRRRVSDRTALALVLGLFALSGALSLSYQVVWSRYLLDFIGVSAYSYAATLAAFMGGLAMGSAWLGRLADRVPRPLALFAALEAGIGLYAFAYPVLQSWVAEAYGRWIAASPEALAASGTAWPRALAASALLLPPTLLMGGTYPAVLRHATASLRLAGRRASEAYAVNALGAAAGSLLAAFLLIPRLGMQGSVWLLGCSNLALAAASAALAAASRRAPADEASASGEASPQPLRPTRALVRAGLAAALGAGFLAFSLELAWTRFLGLVIGSSTHSFAVMLAAFVAGIGLGSLWLSRREDSIPDPLAAFGLVQLGVGVAVLLPLPFYPYLPWLFAQLLHAFAPTAAGYAGYTIAKLLLCAALLLPATFLAGMSLPLLIKGLAASLGGLGRLSGRCYAWNTLGNVAGALVTGLWLLPLLGVERLFRTAALGSALLGLAIVTLRLGARGRGALTAAAAVALLVAHDVSSGPWVREWLVISPFRRLAAAPSLADTRERLASVELLLFRDDPAAHLAVYDIERSGEVERSLLVNGKVDASSRGDLPTQVLLGAIPPLLHPGARDVLVVGLASGITVSAVLDHPVERVDVVELVGTMPEATKLFRRWNGDPLRDPRSRLIAADARHVISHGAGAYDLIVSEPSNPWMAGMGGLFSLDFYRRAVRRLRPGGLYAQWLQSYKLDDATFGVALSTFRDAFPHVYVFQTQSRDLLLLGARAPLRPDWSAALERAHHPAVRRRLEQVGVGDLATVLALQRLSPATVDAIAQQTSERNTDDNRLLEHRAPRHLFSGSRVAMVDLLDERLFASPTLLWSDFAERHPERVDAPSTLETLARRRMRVAAVHEAWTTALLLLQPELGEDPRAESAIAAGDLARPPLPAAALAARLRSLLERDRFALAEHLVVDYAPGLLVASALSADHARLWLDTSAVWAGHPSRPLRQFRIELLMAVGDLGAAAAELSAWVESQPEPPGGWAQLRACLIDREELCRRVRRLASVDRSVE